MLLTQSRSTRKSLACLKDQSDLSQTKVVDKRTMPVPMSSGAARRTVVTKKGSKSRKHFLIEHNRTFSLTKAKPELTNDTGGMSDRRSALRSI